MCRDREIRWTRFYHSLRVEEKSKGGTLSWMEKSVQRVVPDWPEPMTINLGCISFCNRRLLRQSKSTRSARRASRITILPRPLQEKNRSNRATDWNRFSQSCGLAGQAYLSCRMQETRPGYLPPEPVRAPKGIPVRNPVRI